MRSQRPAARFTRAVVALVMLCLVLGGVRANAADTIVHPGDHLHVDVVGEPTVSQDVTVAGDGTIGLPLAGQVRVGGATMTDASAAVARSLARFVRDPHVSLSVLSEGAVRVLVLGDVVNSGEYRLRPGARLSDAITAAGGMQTTIDGAYPVARIALADGTVYHISLEKLLRGGDPTRDIPMPDRAAIYVPGPTTFDVTVLGAVDRPGSLTINEGDRLSIAIARAGTTPNSHADLSNITVTRTEADGRAASHPIDLYQSLEHGDTRYDPVMHKGDVVYVPETKRPSNLLNNALVLLSRLVFIL